MKPTMTEDLWRFNFAMNSYRFPGNLYDETIFSEDYTRITHLSKLLKINRVEQRIGVRVLLNYFVISFNQFGDNFITILLSKCEQKLYPCIISCLKILGKFDPNSVYVVYDRLIDLSTWTPDPILFDRLVLEVYK